VYTLRVNTKEKILSIERKGEKHQIVVSHLTIRQSIFFLVLKLLFLEAVAAAAMISFYIFIVSSGIKAIPYTNINLFNIPFFLALVTLKTGFTIFTIVQWLEEYYEITPKEIIHRNGLLVKREEKYTIDHMASCEMEQGFLGRVFNYGSLKLFDWAQEKFVYVYLIHNPLKYHKVMQTLMPDVDMSKKVFRESVIEDEDL
jgi:membrane protein YdbS with pleckstrin-like domain